MELSHVTEYRFHRSPDGAIWTDTSYEYDFWHRYLKTYDSVAVIGRVCDCAQPKPNWQRVDGPGVRLVPIPNYLGPLQFAKNAWQVEAAVEAAMNSRSAVCLRIPSNLGTFAASVLWRQRRPYAVYVVGDPREAMAPGAMHHPLRGVFRWWFARNQTLQCARAAAALYVTPGLRSAYPPQEAGKVLDCSDVNLDDAAFCTGPRNHQLSANPHLVTVATLSQAYKGLDVLLDALAICRAEGLMLDLTVVGSGRCEVDLRAQAERLGISEAVRFAGALPAGAAVRCELDKADLFVLPSRTEGMPRALLEAMARALPCVATRVGGVPDVLDAGDLVRPGHAVALADKLRCVLSSKPRLDRMSEENLQTARRFHADELYPLWVGFFEDLLDTTRAYFRQQSSGHFLGREVNA